MSTAATEAPVQDLLATMTAASIEQSELDRVRAVASRPGGRGRPARVVPHELPVASDVGVASAGVAQVPTSSARPSAPPASPPGPQDCARAWASVVAEAELEDEEAAADE